MNAFAEMWRGFQRFARKSLTILTGQDNFVQVQDLPQTFGARNRHSPTSANVIMAPVFWIMRNFTEARAVVERRLERNVWEQVDDNPLQMLIDEPNASYNGDALWKATVVSYALDGNAYWQKIRNVFGEVIELWYRPHFMVEPRWSPDGRDFIAYYEFKSGVAGRQPEKIAPQDIVHFRFGIDPENTRKGLSPLKALLREVLTDEEAASFSATILQNMGVPGIVLSPKGDNYKPDPKEAERLRQYLRDAFHGKNRGDPMVMGVPTDVYQFGFDPNKLMLASLRDISEERVCATLGIPAAIVGFGAGLQSTKVGATMRELRRLAWVGCLAPMQNSMAMDLDAQLLPEFQAQTRRFRVRFDRSAVSAFPEDEDMKVATIRRLTDGGLLRLDRAQAALGLEVDPTRRIYLQPAATVMVDEEGEILAPTVDPSPANSADVPPAATPADNQTAAQDPPADQTAQKALRDLHARFIALTPNGNGNGHHS